MVELDACVPDCTDKQCGDDGCGAMCAPGCSTTDACTTAGVCESICQDTWTLPLPNARSGRIVLDGSGSLYMAATDAKKGAILRIGTCLGSETKRIAVDHGSATTSALFALTIKGTDIYAFGDATFGTDPGDAMYARVDTALDTVTFAAPLFGSTGDEEAWGIAVTQSGSVWMGATANLGASAGTPWVVKGDDAGSACGFKPTTGAGSARPIVAAGDKVYIVATGAGVTKLQRFTDAGCVAGPPCSCTPEWTSEDLAVGASSTDARGIRLVGSEAYIVGFATDTAVPDDDYYGFVLRVSLTSGTAKGMYKWNPTAEFDGFVDVAVDGTRVYAGGFQGWTGDATFASATGSVHALPHPLMNNTPADWIDSVTSVHLIVGLDVDDEALYASGWSGGTGASSVAFRCAKATGCP